MCYNETNMDLASSQTFFWLCFGVAVFAVSAFLCWVLYEIARMIRQGNEVVEHTREIVSGIEEDVAQAKKNWAESWVLWPEWPPPPKAWLL